MHMLCVCAYVSTCTCIYMYMEYHVHNTLKSIHQEYIERTYVEKQCTCIVYTYSHSGLEKVHSRNGFKKCLNMA